MTADKGTARSPCPISYALEIFGDRWTLLVLRDLLLNAHRRYGELLASPEGIATNVLADRLRRLEKRGLVSKARDARDSRQFIYTPTEAAIALVPMLLELITWSARNGGVQVPGQLVSQFEENRERCIAETQDAIRQSLIPDELPDDT